MRAVVGDHIVVRSPHTGDAQRAGEILEVHGADGTPPYIVQWEDVNHPTLFVPGADAMVIHENDR